MELRMLLALSLVAASFSVVSGQGRNINLPDTDVVTEYRPGDLRELALIQDPALLQFAARTGERIIVRIEGPMQTVIAQEEVNVNLDCLPWLSRFPGGSIQWLFQTFDEFGSPVGTISVQLPTPESALLTDRRVVGGDFNRWFNITRTIIVQGAQDSDSGQYTCSVCIGRGTVRQICHNATTALFLIGGPPNIDDVESNADPELGSVDDNLVYRIGADFCLTEGLVQTVTLLCGVVGVDVQLSESTPVPSAVRTWSKDDLVIYTAETGLQPELNENFTLLNTDNQVFLMGAVNPAPLVISDLAGTIVLNTAAENFSNPLIAPDVDPENIRGEVFAALLGDYTCEASNIYGNDEATTTVRVCGISPILPGCVTDVIFRQNDQLAPVGCNVCIPEGSSLTLDCTAVSGTEPIGYEWRGPPNNDVVSRSPILTVTMEGDYNCTASNADEPGVSSASVLFFSSGVDFTASITNRFGDVLPDNGCGRLRRPLMSSVLPDICILVGEQLTLDCIEIDTNSLVDVTDMDGMVFESPQVVSSEIDTVYQCRVNTSTPCGSVSTNLTVQVFDPARIDRSVDLQSGELGAGRSTAIEEVSNGEDVTLACPANGIDDPVTEWFRVLVDENGNCMEVPANISDPDIQLEFRDNGTVALLNILSYNSTRDDGTYICRTSNIVGDDAGLVVLTADQETGEWSVGDSSECNVPCREGVRVRSVTCRSTRDGRILPDSECSASDMPSQSLSCSDIFPDECLLNPIFITGKFSPCSEGCRGGFRERDVSCVVPMTGDILDNKRCSPIRQPNIRERCPNICCYEDQYPFACKRIGSALCNINRFQQICCWTCLLREIP